LGGTWDFFKYPGIRSDSDMYTFGFSFRPWTARKMIAPKEDILKYLWNVVHEFDLEKHVRFNTEVSDASFSSDRGTWYVDCKNGKRYSCSFLFMCTGYYKYDKGYTPDFEGMDEFRGRIVHPQAWDESIDYEGKRVVVIGSGATAATLIPALAEKAKFVTMLQRSPGYYAARPSETSGVSKFLNGISPYLGHWLNRWRSIWMGSFLWYMSKTYPKLVRNAIIKDIRSRTPKDFDVDTHFNPKYNPWDQRVCLVPDGDFFEALKRGCVKVVTDHVDRFTESGVRTRSGEILEADIVVTATGLNLQTNFPMSNIRVVVDNKTYDSPQSIMYRGVMLSEVPNFAFTMGYANASWTLKAELTCVFVCRLLNDMDRSGKDICIVKRDDSAVDENEQFFDLSSGYLMRVKDRMPKQGNKSPWKLNQDYTLDMMNLSFRKIQDGVLKFQLSGQRRRDLLDSRRRDEMIPSVSEHRRARL
jgi:monooxygenase